MGRSSPDTTGEKWNDWTIIEEVGYTQSGHLKVIARCRCGTVKEVFYHKLKHGTSKCCGKCQYIIVKQGDRFGRWTVIGEKFILKNYTKQWLCRCDCGTEKVVDEYKLTHKLTNSCGCYMRESVSKRTKSHGKSHTKIHNEWEHMKRRCLPDAECKSRYYDRGITVCDEWKENFDSFFDYVSKLDNFEKDGFSLDRIDNNKGYGPGNMRWASPKEQSRNREDNIHVIYKGEDRLFCELVEEKNLPYQTIRARIKKGWSVDSAIDTPIKSKKR